MGRNNTSTSLLCRLAEVFHGRGQVAFRRHRHRNLRSLKATAHELLTIARMSSELTNVLDEDPFFAERVQTPHKPSIQGRL